MKTGRRVQYKDRLYNKEMSELGLSVIRRLRANVSAYVNYGSIAIDGFSTNSGIAGGTNYTYTGNPDYDVKLTAGQTSGNFYSVSFAFAEMPELLGIVLMLSDDTSDITVELSRDGGVNYVSCPLVKIETGLYRSAEMVDMSDCDEDTDVVYKISFANSTSVKVKGVAVFGR